MIGLLGISYKSADIKIREQYSFLPEDVENFNNILSKNSNYKGAVVISTCNRTEIYFRCRNSENKQVIELIFNTLSILKNYQPEHREFFYFKSGRDVAEHLFKVVSGIDSLIIGEDQIIGQVKQAFKLAQDIKSADSILSRLFTKAFEAGKKVRSLTKINEGSASVSAAAVDLCVSHFPDLHNQNLFIIGAGETGRLVLKSLYNKKLKSLHIANRTIDKAQKLAAQYGGNGCGLDKIAEILPTSSIVLVATNSQNYLLDKSMLKSMSPDKKQLFIDLSVPRNIDPEIANLPNATLYAVDDLIEIVNSTTEQRNKAIDDAQIIINELVAEYMDWLTIRGLSPIFARIKDNFRKIHQSEVNDFAKINGIENGEIIENYGKHISDKYARLFIRNLRSMAQNGRSKESLEAINQLFDIG